MNSPGNRHRNQYLKTSRGLLRPITPINLMSHRQPIALPLEPRDTGDRLLKNSFNEAHILAVSQAICEYRKAHKIKGPLFLGMDTHALSEPAFASAIEVFAANKVNVLIQKGFRYTPTPVISHAILTYNGKIRGSRGRADGVVITPSHNPPEDGGIKYNPPHGGPADTAVTKVIEERANELLSKGLKGVKRILFEKAIRTEYIKEYDYISPYVEDLGNIIDMEIIAKAGLKIGVDPLGGASVDFWHPIAERYRPGARSRQ